MGGPRNGYGMQVKGCKGRVSRGKNGPEESGDEEKGGELGHM